MSLQDLTNAAQSGFPRQSPAYPDRSGLVQLTQPLANGGGLGFGSSDVEPDGYAAGGRTSSDWLDYLLGRSPTAPMVQTATQAPGTPYGGNPEMTKAGYYTYDPASQTYKWNEAMKAAEAASEPVGRASGSYATQQAMLQENASPWSNMSEQQKIAWYAEHPTQAKVAGALQDLFGATMLGTLSKKLNPEGWYTAEAQRRLFSPTEGQQQLTNYETGLAGLAEQGRMAQQEQQTAQMAQDNIDAGGGWNPGAANLSGLGTGAEGVGGYGTYSPSSDSGSSSSGAAHGGLMALAGGGAAGAYNLGDYSDGGRLLRGPGDGVSDSIPATIGDKRPARLADGEFVVPARIVSELGNGSTDAGARKLYEMMDRIQKARNQTVGKGKVAVNSRADKHLPA